MEDFWIGAQLVIGEQEKNTFSKEQIRRSIIRAKEIANISSLIIWTEYDLKVYESLIKMCQEHCVETYLWFPVLADVQGYSLSRDDLLINYEDKQGYGKIGVWEKLGIGDENFLFACPNNDYAVGNVFQVFRTLVDRLDLDGVMLDRIRYPSVVNGFENLFTCFCNFCRSKFYKSHGFSLESCRKSVYDFLAKLKRISIAELNEWESLDSLWYYSGMNDFAFFRKRNIFDIVKKFSDYACVKGLQVGLDLYSISISTLVAQDYSLLSKTCNWIKPMTYCHALGPAGLPLEIASLLRALKILCPRLDERDLKNILEKLLHWNLPENETLLIQEGLPEDTVIVELENIQKQELSREVRVYPGIEALRHPCFNISITEEVLERYLSILSQYTSGFIASWNLLYIPEENLKLIGMMYR